MNRRDFVKQAGTLPLSVGLLPASALAASRPQSPPPRSYAEDMPDMLVTYLCNKANLLSDKWDRERSNIRTSDEIAARNRFVRAKIIAMIHGYPERTPLNPVTVRVLERDGYRIECIMFESRPNFWVTSSLYIPTVGAGPFPGILSPCGHEHKGRTHPPFQAAYLNMVRNGFVVLADDPIGDGERREYWDPRTGKSELGGPPTWEHMVGQPLLLLGEDLVHCRLWDDMRALDYLLTRPEVDPKRIGCAGQSSGGLYTKFLSVLDDRIHCAAVHEGGTENRWPVRIRRDGSLSTGTGDIDQHLFPSALYGIDSVDAQLVFAPRPLLVTIEDYSPSFQSAAHTIAECYRQLGVPEKFKTVDSTDPHGWTTKLRIANTDWFCRWLYGRPGPETEPEFQLERDEALYCTPNGSIRHSQQGQTIFSLMLKKQAQLPPTRRAPTTQSELQDYRSRIGADIRKLLRYQHFDQPPAPRLLVTTPRKGYRIEKLEFLSEPGIYVPAWVFLPKTVRERRTAILYVNDAGKEIEGLEFGLLEELALKGETVVAVDVRGIGATKPRPMAVASGGEFPNLSGAELILTYGSWEVDEELFGMRVQDVIRSVDYILSRPDMNQGGVRVMGKGMGALWALYAAALDTRIGAVICEEGLLSYQSLTTVDRYVHEASIFIRDALKYLDLPQVAAAVADRPLAILSPVDAMKAPVEVSDARGTYRWTEKVYTNLGVGHRFHLLSHDPHAILADEYLALLSP